MGSMPDVTLLEALRKPYLYGFYRSRTDPKFAIRIDGTAPVLGDGWIASSMAILERVATGWSVKQYSTDVHISDVDFTDYEPMNVA